MSTEGVAKSPPEQGGAAPPAPNLTVSASAAAAQPSNTTSSEYANSNSDTSAATAKPKNGKVPAYDKKWLENLNLLKPCIKEDGVMDYSSLDEEAQKRLQNFVKDQRKCYKKREKNESTPMTDERFRLLSEAKFDFVPSETNKAKREKEKEEKKKMAKALFQQQLKGQAKKKAATEQSKNSSGESATTPAKAKSVECTERDDSAKELTPGKAKKFIPLKREEPTPDSKMSAIKTPKSTSDSNMPAIKTPKSASDSKMPASKTPKSTSDSKTPASKTPKSASDSKMPASKTPMASSKKSPATASSARKKPGKPTYLEMAHDAIASLKDRTGSSVPAISKWILANNEDAKSASPNVFKTRLSKSIKQGMKDGRFMKVKNSYKINVDWTKKQKAAAKAKEAAKKKVEKQRQKDFDQAKQQKKVEAEKEKKKADEEKKRKENVITPEERAEAARKKKRKEEAEARKKYIEQQLRKRRLPIEDTKLHREDKEWGVKPPEDVTKRPALPHTLTCLIPPHLRENIPKKYRGSAANASASGNGLLLGGDNERGLVTDAIHVYHFFCGDVGLVDADNPVPKFSLKTLFYALDEVLNGNTKASRSLPPLLTHLFVTALRMLTAPQQVDGDDNDEQDDADLGPGELRLQRDLSKLREGLNAVSWSQICSFYMDLMERYYTSDVSLEEGVLPGEGNLDMSYLWNKDKMEEDEIEASDGMLPNRYNAYLGDPQGALVKGYSKLQNQAEPWSLKADELMALLRTLTDDILARRPDLTEDIAGRGDKLYELSKAKRAAVVKFNKVRLAHEGPKRPSRQKKSDGDESKAENKKDEQDLKEESEKPFVPTATKQQFVAAEKAYIKAVEAYDNGLNKLISRTEPVAFDRNFNAIYFFRHDPTMLHVEQLKQSSLPSEVNILGPEVIPFSSWHIIDTKPLFEQFMASLDDRGQREDEVLKICSNLTVLKRRLQDEKKEKTGAVAREREKEELERRLENARSACDAEDGRRSGRLAGMAQGELKNLEVEIRQMAKAHENEEQQEKLGREKATDYSLLTGLQMVADLFAGQRATRSTKKSDNDGRNEAALLANVPSHKLWMDESIGGNGTLHILVEALFALEEKCNDLSPWTRQDMTREAWRKQLSDASCAWAIDCVMQLGPSADTSPQEDDPSEDQYGLTSPTKKQKVEPASSGTSLANIVNTIKLCLKGLELRVFEISGKKKAIEEADLAAAEIEDASSDEEDNRELHKRRNCWKIKINALRRLPSTRYGLIRDIIVAAITVARKSHLNQVAAELKAALQLLRPGAASEAKSAATQVLEKYGGYEGSDDEDEDVDFDELAAANAGDANVEDKADGAEIASLLCDEVRMISGSVGGDDFADKSDWSDAIKDCKSVSRLAVMVQSFLSKADDTLKQMKEERDNLDSILGLNAKRTSRSKSHVKKHDSSTAIWCNTELTDKLVKARVKGFPWWPAHVCIPLESVVADALTGSGYTLISSVGNPGMFMLDEKDMMDFTEETDEDLSQYDKSTLDELHESTTIAKKLWRLQNRGVASPWSKKSRPRFTEEKKTAH